MLMKASDAAKTAQAAKSTEEDDRYYYYLGKAEMEIEAASKLGKFSTVVDMHHNDASRVRAINFLHGYGYQCITHMGKVTIIWK